MGFICINQNQTEQEKIIDILIGKRRDMMIRRKEQKFELHLKEETLKKLQEEFYNDLNNESKLIIYHE